MKNLVSFSSLFAALCLAAPSAGWTKDKHHHHHNSHNHSSHHHHSYSRGYCPPTTGYYGYRPYIGYTSYPSYYGYSSYYPTYSYPAYSYYSRPSIGISFSTASKSYRSASDDDDLTVDVQRALARRGYYRGAIDGDAGPGTRGAIREFQYRNRLEVTGRIDRTLLRSLGVS